MVLGTSLHEHVSYWNSITDNNVILDWISEGVTIPLCEIPQPFYFTNKQFNKKETAFIDEEIKILLQEKCLEECKTGVVPQYVSPIQTVPKKDSFRLITDLRHLNQFCVPPKFVYEDIENVLEIVSPLDKLVTLDLKNGFFHVPIKESCRDYLCFQYKNKYYRWCVLPFGSNVSPFYFCKVVRCVIEHFRRNNVKIVSYVDDFVLSGSENNIERSRDWVLGELKNLGLKVNFEKSCLEPGHRVKFIGYVIDTARHKDAVWLAIPRDRLNKVKKDINRVLKNGKGSARSLARIAGQCVSMTKVIIPAKLLLRNLYRCLKQKKGWQDILTIDSDTAQDLNWWWSALDHWNGRAVESKCKEVIQITTDASLEGWGAQLLLDPVQEAQGFWDTQVSAESSNYRELYAIYLSLMSFLPGIRGRSVQVLSDNVTAVAYINFQGGPSRLLTNIATKIWTLAVKNNMSIQAKHLAGRLNTKADGLSRLTGQYEWSIHPHLFRYLDTLWGPHTIDRFASMTTTQCNRYNSLYLDPNTYGVDALHQSDWRSENNYVNAPVRLMDKVLRVIQAQKATATIIAPVWKAKNWYYKLKEMSIAPAIRLPSAQQFCIPLSIATPEAVKNRKWVWCAWRISGLKN